MGCLVEIIFYKEPCRTIVTQGEFDETINQFDETNIVIVNPDPDEETIALVV